MPKPCIAPEPVMTSTGDQLRCFLCGTQDIKRLWEGSDKKFRGPGRFTHMKCGACELVFLYPRPTDKEMTQYYPDHVTPVRRDASASFWEKTRHYVKRAVAEDWYGYAASPPALPQRPLAWLRKGLTLPLRSLLHQLPGQRPGGRAACWCCGRDH